MFVFRIIVDIASKALSPAINDPTTAVLAIDQLHHLLRDVGTRYLAEGHEKDRTGKSYAWFIARLTGKTLFKLRSPKFGSTVATAFR